ncbi:MAG: hypothetical protein H7Z40_23155 [Phycisphaerae bacterium]|nr:hypothetical protein [Gemmatimonadaceae bacterium]
MMLTTRRLLLPILALSAMTACASSFFRITPEDGSTPSTDKPAAKPADKVAEKKPEKPRDEPKAPVVKEPVVKAPPVVKPEPRKAEPVKQTAVRPAAAPPPAPPIVRRPEPIVEPAALEPTPAGSDSAGIARLMHAAALWDAVRLFHPQAASYSAGWDNATVRRLTDIRTATTREQYIAALNEWLSKLDDPVTRIQLADAGDVATSAGAAAEVATQMQIVVGGTRKVRTADTTVVVTWPTGATSLDTAAWSSLRSALRNTGSISQLVIDLRAAPYAGVSIPNDSVLRTKQLEVASLLTAFTVAGPSIRKRSYFGWHDDRVEVPTNAATSWHVSAPLVVVKGQATSQPRRIVLVANAATEMAPALLALVSNGQATLVSEAALSDRLLVPRTQIAMGDGIRATIRTGELFNANGTSRIQPDTIVAPAVQPTDSAPVLRTAMLIARGRLQVGSVAARTLADHYKFAGDIVSPRDITWNSAHYPIMGARLLAAFKMWGTLRAFHAYNELRDENIDDALFRIIPRVEAATDAYSYASAMLDFASATSDAQVRLNSPTLEQHIGAAAAPFAARWIEGRAIVTRIAPNAAGLVVGEEITAADGYPMAAYVNEHRRYSAASNDWTRFRTTMEMIPRGAAGTATYRVRDANNRERSVTIERTVDNFRSSVTDDRSESVVVKDLDSGFGYLDLARATVTDVERAFREFGASRALILDARAGAVAAVDDESRLPPTLRVALQRLLPSPRAVIGKETLRLPSEPCPPTASQLPTTACAIDRRQFDDVIAADTSRRYRGRVVVLIDERTEGAMEQFAMATETASNATLIGGPSAGAAGMVTGTQLPGFLTLSFSGTELRRADGGQLQRVGLTPQVDARPTVKGVRAGTDDVLERAQQWLKEQLDPQPVRRRR